MYYTLAHLLREPLSCSPCSIYIRGAAPCRLSFLVIVADRAPKGKYWVEDRRKMPVSTSALGSISGGEFLLHGSSPFPTRKTDRDSRFYLVSTPRLCITFLLLRISGCFMAPFWFVFMSPIWLHFWIKFYFFPTVPRVYVLQDFS